MAAGGFTTEYTMIEVAKNIGAQGNDLALIDTLSQRTPFLEEGYWMEADDFNSHHFIQSLSEPVGVDSVINVGVGWDVATQTPVTELIQGLEDYLRIDMRILSRRRNPQQYVKQQCDTFIRGLKKTIHDRLLYGNYTANTAVGVGPSTSIGGASADRITGLAQRYNTIATNPWYNVTSATGSTSNSLSSAWAIVWGPDATFFVYPHGGQDFVKVEDIGEQLVYDSNQKPYKAYIVHFLIQFGLCVADPRKVQRLANIYKTTQTWTPTLQLQSLGQLPDGYDGAVLYVPRFVWTQMQVDALLGTNKLYTKEEVWGHVQTMFQGVPVRMVERIATNEAQVS